MVYGACFRSVLAASCVACGGAVASQPAGSDAAASFDAEVEPTADAASSRDSAVADAAIDARDPVSCAGGGSIAYDKSCNADSDCVVVTIYLGCCHSAALGCNVSGAASLVDAGAACGMLDPCDCAGNVVVADDGRVSRAPGQTDVAVACDAGLCTSTVK